MTTTSLALIRKAISGTPWDDEEIDRMGPSGALEIAQSSHFHKLPEWAAFVVEGILIEYHIESANAQRSLEWRTRLPQRVLDVIAAMTKYPVKIGRRRRLRRKEKKAEPLQAESSRDLR
jgi:hypothetical protein